MAPPGNVVYELPADCRSTMLLGSTSSMPSRQPSSRPTVRIWIGVGATSSKLPIMATPQVLRLNPPVWNPSTGLVRPPALPSNTWPYLSTRALYAMSHQPRVLLW
ncbi:Uncharacterised protein [Mycobacterium tuberculosis]|nr:Uncharacterised protein [Mycobacterium tuberculosis]